MTDPVLWYDPAQDGGDATGVTPPAGGWGIRGWLSGIYAKLSGALAVTGTFWQAVQPTSVAPLTYTTNGAVSVGTTSGVLVAAGGCGRSLIVGTQPGSTSNVWLNVAGGEAAVGSGIMMGRGGGSFSFGGAGAPIPTAQINAITDGVSAQSVWLAGG